MRIGKGFTLIEIMIVVAIIALLAVIAVPQYLRSRMNVNETAAIASLKTLHKASSMFYSANDSSYPPGGLCRIWLMRIQRI